MINIAFFFNLPPLSPIRCASFSHLFLIKKSDTREVAQVYVCIIPLLNRLLLLRVVLFCQ